MQSTEPVPPGPVRAAYYLTLELSAGLRTGNPKALARLQTAVSGASGPVEVARRLGVPYRSLARWRHDIPAVAEILGSLQPGQNSTKNHTLT